MSSARFVIAMFAGALVACRGERTGSVPAFAVVRTVPAQSPETPLLLNQELTVYFSAPIDPLSVTPDTVRVLDATGHHLEKARLRTGSQSVTFVPSPPLAPDLGDGALRPDAAYRLLVAGYPADNAVRSRDGRVLAASLNVPFRTVPANAAPLGLPSPLLPVGAGLEPFLLRNTDVPGRVPADAALIRLQFTLPVLPTTLGPKALAISLLRKGEQGLRRIETQGMRLLSQPPPIDDHPGCTLEIDLGRDLLVEGGSGPDHLQAGDILAVELVRGASQLTDYACRPLLGPDHPVRLFEVIAGASQILAEWPPAGAPPWAADDPLLPGFEILRGNALRPRVRVEAGSGQLGVFRPHNDTELRPGVPFDRGDGTMVSSQGDVFPFLAIEVPRGVTVRIAAAGRPLLLLACGSIRIDGTIELSCAGIEPAVRPYMEITPRAVLDASPVAVVAGSDLLVAGSVRSADAAALPADRSLLTLMAGRVELRGTVPPNTVLAFEEGTSTVENLIPVHVQLTPGLPPGALLDVAAASPWAALPPDRESAEVELDLAVPGVQVAIQFAPPDVVPGRPDPLVERWSQPRAVSDRTQVAFPPGSMARALLLARVTGGSPPPLLRALRLRAR